MTTTTELAVVTPTPDWQLLGWDRPPVYICACGVASWRLDDFLSHALRCWPVRRRAREERERLAALLADHEAA